MWWPSIRLHMVREPFGFICVQKVVGTDVQTVVDFPSVLDHMHAPLSLCMCQYEGSRQATILKHVDHIHLEREFQDFRSGDSGTHVPHPAAASNIEKGVGVHTGTLRKIMK